MTVGALTLGRLRHPRLCEQGLGLAAGPHSHTHSDVLDAYACQPKIPGDRVPIFVRALKGYDVPNLGYFRAVVGDRPADLSIEGRLAGCEKLFQILDLRRS